MKLPWLLQDTIAARFAATVMLAAFVAVGLNLGFERFGGIIAQPPLLATGLLDQAVVLLQVMEATSTADRPRLAKAIQGHGVQVGWFAADSPVSYLFDSLERFSQPDDRYVADRLGDHDRPFVKFTADSPISKALSLDRRLNPEAFSLAWRMTDRSWIVFTVLRRSWGLSANQHVAIELGFLAFSVGVVSVVAARLLARPIKQFSDGVRRFGGDPRAPPIPVTGPQELRLVIRAFNDMQEQVQRFVADRTEMLAAISHDLRTPLTRIRLRAELLEDTEQQRRIFRDVDDMQAMVDSALAFFQDDATAEEPTAFDLPELLRTIVEDYNDQGHPVTYDGPDRSTCFGRPYALKRALVNLVDNALKYATPPVLALRRDGTLAAIMIRDAGPGIPVERLADVFAPFVRLERSRNRQTGGVGLGLAVARGIVRAHGGDIVLSNPPGGGLQATVHVPLNIR